jgi:hypothetical protein
MTIGVVVLGLLCVASAVWLVRHAAGRSSPIERLELACTGVGALITGVAILTYQSSRQFPFAFIAMGVGFLAAGALLGAVDIFQRKPEK